jgi:hypothetical protein
VAASIRASSAILPDLAMPTKGKMIDSINHVISGELESNPTLLKLRKLKAENAI